MSSRGKRISLIAIAFLAIVSLIACGFVYVKKQQERHEMLIRAASQFAVSQKVEIAGELFGTAKYNIKAEEEDIAVSSEVGQRFPVTVTDRSMIDLTIPDSAEVTKIVMTKDGEKFFEGDLAGFLDGFLPNGTYDTEVYCDVNGKITAEDGSVLTMKGGEIFALRISVDIPTEFHLSRTEMVQGSGVAVIGTNVSGEVSATAPGVIDTINFTVDDKGYAQALLSSTFRCSPGEYECIVSYNGEKIVLPFTVTEGTYTVQHLTISTSTAAATVGNDEAMADYNGMIAATNLIWTPERYYEDNFIMPVNGPITTEFGLYRYTNGSSTPSRHVGLDIAEDEGTPVQAAASGIVVVSRWVGTTGYSVCIDHGYGVRSYYYHMSALTAEVGDFVEQGQEIGKVGQTGYASGPHVHFNIMVGDNSINPWPVFEGTSGIFDLAKTEVKSNG
ncbi:MAG: M23 family metallopeptidase [Oscillospiraceae bacterium]|nr:M23 family metallopeptidase [Oscillospiraceae bacterium]